DQRRLVCGGRGVRGLDGRDAVARHEFLGPADPAERRHLPAGPRVGADRVIALQRTKVMTSVLVIVPTYNERSNVPTLVSGLLQHADVRVLMLDDASPDGTGEVADRLASDHPGLVSVLHRTTDRGFGRSYLDGIRSAVKEPVDVICQMDAHL